MDSTAASSPGRGYDRRRSAEEKTRRFALIRGALRVSWRGDELTSLRIGTSALMRREMVFQLFFSLRRSRPALGWNGSGNLRLGGQGHQGSETNAEAENARQGCVLVVMIFSRSFDRLITCVRSLDDDHWMGGRGYEPYRVLCLRTSNACGSRCDERWVAHQGSRGTSSSFSIFSHGYSVASRVVRVIGFG